MCSLLWDRYHQMLALQMMFWMSLAFSKRFYCWARLDSYLNQSGNFLASFYKNYEYFCFVSGSRSFRLYLNSFYRRSGKSGQTLGILSVTLVIFGQVLLTFSNVSNTILFNLPYKYYSSLYTQKSIIYGIMYLI